MKSRFYKLVFKGERNPALTDEQLLRNLTDFGVDAQQAEQFLREGEGVIRSGLTRDQAESYEQRLFAAGLKVELEEQQEESVSGTEPAPESAIHATSAGPGHAAALPRRSEQVRFTGRGSEYFRIWIVNIMLLIVTLGFYAPWAKVRNNQYFYGHTEVDGASFQYLADPWVIFRGRLVAMGVLAVWLIANSLFPLVALVLSLPFMLLIPWIVIRALKFHANNSAYRNIRFDFNAGYWQAVMVLWIWPLLSILSFMLLAPYSVLKSQKFVVDNARFGQTPFRLNASVGAFYLFFLKMAGVAVGFILLGALVALVNPMLVFAVQIIGYLILFGFVMAALTNLVFNSTVLGAHGFRSELSKRRMVWIFTSNILLIALTLGLFSPWAKVRMATYRAECTKVEICGDLDGFLAAEQQHTSALGQELGAAFDLGVGFV